MPLNGEAVIYGEMIQQRFDIDRRQSWNSQPIDPNNASVVLTQDRSVSGEYLIPVSANVDARLGDPGYVLEHFGPQYNPSLPAWSAGRNDAISNWPGAAWRRWTGNMRF